MTGGASAMTISITGRGGVSECAIAAHAGELTTIVAPGSPPLGRGTMCDEILFAAVPLGNDPGTLRHRMILDYLHHKPQVGAGADVAGRGVVIGRSMIGTQLSFADYATVRGDGENIRIGDNAWFGEHATVHIADQVLGAVVGNDVTVGRYGLVHACTLGDDAGERSSWSRLVQEFPSSAYGPVARQRLGELRRSPSQ